MQRSANASRKKGSQLQSFTDRIDADPTHHLAGPFRPQTPLGVESEDSDIPSPTYPSKSWRGSSSLVPWSTQSRGFWTDIKSLRWVVVPSSSLKILLFVLTLWAVWEIVTPCIPVANAIANPFAALLFISHRVPTSSADDPRYSKGYLDLAFVAYYFVFWSFVRQTITLYVCRPIARSQGIRKEKLDRFGEQGYAIIYFAVMAAWGTRIMSQLPTWWYRTEHFWIDYPHWDMKPELKCYYLLQMAYWCQQLVVLGLGLEKPRKDYRELVAHHFVTLWLVGWSYLLNLTVIGNAVYLSMDLPDSFLGLSMLLNYLQWQRAKLAVFSVFFFIWGYFRHWLNWVILYSVLFEFDLMPASSKRWAPEEGVWMAAWMRYQIFTPLLLLQGLNLFWYFLIGRIAVRAIKDVSAPTDDRSDDEDDGDTKDDGDDDDDASDKQTKPAFPS